MFVCHFLLSHRLPRSGVLQLGFLSTNWFKCCCYWCSSFIHKSICEPQPMLAFHKAYKLHNFTVKLHLQIKSQLQILCNQKWQLMKPYKLITARPITHSLHYVYISIYTHKVNSHRHSSIVHFPGYHLYVVSPTVCSHYITFHLGSLELSKLLLPSRLLLVFI